MVCPLFSSALVGLSVPLLKMLTIYYHSEWADAIEKTEKTTRFENFFSFF